MRISSFPRVSIAPLLAPCRCMITPALFSNHKSLPPAVLRPALPVLCGVSARKIGDAGELIDGAGRADFRNSATGPRNSAQHFEWIGLPFVLQGAVAATQACNEVLGDRHAARGWQTCDARRGWRI